MKRATPVLLVLLLVLGGQFVSANNDADPFVINFLPTDLEFDPIRTFTTTEAQLYTGLYEGLVTYDPYSLDPLPGVASRWEVLDEGRTYRFTIRPDARFSDGSPVRAEDFVATWLMMLEPSTNAAYASLLDVVVGATDFRTGVNRDRASVGIRAVSDRVLEVRLTERATHFLRILCHHSFVPLHPAVRDGHLWDDPTRLITNGPYVIAEYQPDRIVLERNPMYWDRERVKLDRIEALFSDDVEDVAARFNAGEIDWVYSAIDFSLVENQSSIVVSSMFSTTYFQFSATIPPLDNLSVRRAMMLALPWEEIRSEDYEYLPTSSLVPPLPQYPEVTGFETQDAEEARRVLEEAGIDGASLPNVVISIPGGQDNERIGQLMVDAWGDELGISATIETIPYTRYFQDVEDGLQVATISWIGDFADPLTFLDMWTSVSNLNYSGLANPEYDSLILLAMGQLGSERYETLARAEELLLDQCVVLPISHSPSANLINLDAVDGWYPNPLNIHPLKYMGRSSGEPVPNVAFAMP